VYRQWDTVWPSGDHRVECVCDAEKPSFDWNRVTAETAGIATAVPPLVMEENVGQRHRSAAKRRDQGRARRRMHLDLEPLGECQRSRLAQQIAANGDLADVVERSAEAELRDPPLIPAEQPRDRLGERRHSRPVSLCLIALLERERD
jgi:hypothetical protein